MKKLISSLLIVALIFNFIINSICYAETDGTSALGTSSDWLSSEDGSIQPNATDILEEGDDSSDASGGISILGVIMGYLALMIDIIPLQIQLILSAITTTETLDASGSEISEFWITIERIVFNEIALFNVNYFDTDENYTVGNGAEQLTITHSESSKSIKESITMMYTICRMIAMIIGLLVLIYIGIRMALSTVASDKAKYKKMLYSWVESMVVLFIMVYIIVIIINVGESLINLFYDIRHAILGTEKGFEVTISESITKNLFQSSGLQLALYSLMYWVVIFSQLKFFYLYIKRTLMVGFLIMIAPLITITYSIDKAGDGKAQAFSKWLSELVINVLIQPLHALIYLVFILSAGEIAKIAPIVALIFMISLGSAEKIIKTIFNVGGITSLMGLDKGFKKK